MKKIITIRCECGKMFGASNISNRVYCSRKCQRFYWDKTQKERRETKEFKQYFKEYRGKNKVRINEYNRKYIKEWLKERRGYISAKMYKISFNEFKEITKNGCIVCGFNLTIDIHHKDNDRNNNKKDNLICLCPNHHALVTRKIKSLNELLKKLGTMNVDCF